MARQILAVLLFVAAFSYWAPFGRIGAQNQNFADVSLIPGQTIVIVRDPQGADQMLITTFFWQKVTGIEKPIMRSVTSVVPVIQDSPVAADGAPNPADVVTVHVSLVKITSRMQWDAPKPTAPVTPPK